MINKLIIKNFKSHSNSAIGLSNINIFTGMNGMGKSSAIQSLLLLRQTQSKGLLERGLELNGDLCSIGTIADAIYAFSEDSDDIEFSIEENGKNFNWIFSAEAKSVGNTFALSKRSPEIHEQLQNFFGNGFQYISAHRNGPVNDYEKDTASVELLNQISRKEGRCELVAHFLHYHKDYIVDPDLIRNIEVGNTVLDQVKEWMKDVSPNINITITPLDTSFKISYGFNRGTGLTKLENVKASNTGFGVSYVLPIIVAILVATAQDPRDNGDFYPPNHLIIIENPEAHIHPKAQAKLMELICLAAKKGVQIIIETHSDHIINSLLVEVKKEILNPEQSKIYFFERNEETHSTDVIELPILEGGKIRKPPEGFFDQIDIHMKQLMGF